MVTGAGRGFGRALALAFAAEGGSVALVARTESELNETALTIRSAGGEALVLPADVSQQHEADAVVIHALNTFGDIDILVNNAGKQGPVGPLVANDPGEWVQTVATNLFGPFYLCRALLPHMLERKGGRIINVSGGGATGPRPNFTAYAASKAALVRFTETLAEELKPHGVQVNAVAPGTLDTQMLVEMLAAGEHAGLEQKAASIVHAKGAESLQLAVELVVFLASHAPDSLTGKLISAPHDPWRDWIDDDVPEDGLYTLRRLDPHTVKPLLGALS
jgi:NAD(P)-dependent dehydrogenase (short-subunit alcohol dehydrogenase family)